MKINKSSKNTVILCAAAVTAALALVSCSIPSYPGYDSSSVVPGSDASAEAVNFKDYSSCTIPAAEVGSDFMRGVDASEVRALEENGVIFYNENNEEQDVFQIMANDGVNWIRLRLWNDYTQALDDEWGPYGYNNLTRTINMAQRAKKAGMKVLLDFHYSDTWADPSKQKCPAMWADITTADELAQAVADYTKAVLQKMSAQDCAPDMIQIGNEMQGGIFQTGSAVSNAKAYTAQYLTAAAKVIRSLLPECKIMLHMSNGGKEAYADTILEYAAAIGNDDDGNALITTLGVSYYSWYAEHGTDVMLKKNLQKFKDAGYQAVIAENSYAYSDEAYIDSVDNTCWQQGSQTAANLTGYDKGLGIVDNDISSSIENQAGIAQYLMELCSSVDEAGGYFYWGGCYLASDNMPSAWENQALFDVNGKVLPSLKVFKKN